MPLSSGGEISLRVVVESVVPPHRSAGTAFVAARPFLQALRGLFLYVRQPYDKTWVQQLRDWRYLLSLYVAIGCGTVWRVAFYTAYLVSIATRERDHWQLVRFIASLKGTQFAVGVWSLGQIVLSFLSCAVLTSADDARPPAEADRCLSAAPGVGHALLSEGLWLLWLQALVWLAFLLLPFAGAFEPHHGRVSHVAADQLWDEVSAALQASGHVVEPGTMPPSPAEKAFRMDARGYARLDEVCDARRRVRCS